MHLECLGCNWHILLLFKSIWQVLRLKSIWQILQFKSICQILYFKSIWSTRLFKSIWLHCQLESFKLIQKHHRQHFPENRQMKLTIVLKHAWEEKTGWWRGSCKRNLVCSFEAVKLQALMIVHQIRINQKWYLWLRKRGWKERKARNPTPLKLWGFWPEVMFHQIGVAAEKQRFVALQSGEWRPA